MTNSHEMPPPIKSAPFYVNFMQYRLIQHFVVLELAIAGAATTMRSASIVAQKKQKGSPLPWEKVARLADPNVAFICSCDYSWETDWQIST